MNFTLSSLSGENGILKRAQVAKDTTNKNQATETMNLKITNIQIFSFFLIFFLLNLSYSPTLDLLLH